MTLLPSIFKEWERFPHELDEYVSADIFAPFRGSLRPLSPTVDIKEEKDKFIVTADIPGMEKKDITVELKNGMLSITGERESEKKDKSNGYHRVERRFGKFQRSFAIDTNKIMEDKIKAEYKKGVLLLELPKKQELKEKETVKRITIN